MTSRALRILHCPHNVGANPQGLARAEREIGLDSWAVALEAHPFGYPIDEVLWGGSLGVAGRELSRIKLFARALRGFDVIHFNFGQSCTPSLISFDRPSLSRRLSIPWRVALPLVRWGIGLIELRDLPILRRLGKGIVVTFQGSDARQGDYCRTHFRISPADEVGSEYFSDWSDRHKRYRIRMIDRYADRLYALNPDLLHVLPDRTEFLPYGHIDLADWRPIDSQGVEVNAEPLVVHVPSNQAMKGTKYVLAAVEDLRCRGIPFRFQLLEEGSHDEVRKALQAADLVIDQLLCGWYGGLAVEAMALGKPVICYLRDEDLGFLDPKMRASIPILNATPQTITSVLEASLAAGLDSLREAGARSRAYVEAWHDPARIAKRLQRDYEAILQRT